MGRRTNYDQPNRPYAHQPIKKHMLETMIWLSTILTRGLRDLARTNVLRARCLRAACATLRAPAFPATSFFLLAQALARCLRNLPPAMLLQS